MLIVGSAFPPLTVRDFFQMQKLEWITKKSKGTQKNRTALKEDLTVPSSKLRFDLDSRKNIMPRS